MVSFENRVRNRPKPESETEPTVTVDFLFSPHGTAEDWRGFRSHFNQADVYIPEVSGWTSRDLQVLQDVSGGDERYGRLAETRMKKARRTVQEFLRTVFDPSHFYDMRDQITLELELLHNSKKPVVMIDVSDKDPLHEEFDELDRREDEQMNIAFDQFCDGHYDEAIVAMQQMIELTQLDNQNRNKYLAHQLATRLPHLREQFPELRQKTHIRALVCLGTMHTPVYHAVRHHIPATMSFGAPLNVLTPSNEAVRRLEYRKSIDEHLLAKTLMEISAHYLLPEEMIEKMPHIIYAATLRRMTQSWTAEEVRQLSTQLGQLREEDRNSFLITAFQRKGIPIPQSLKEARQLLKADPNYGNRIE